MADSPDKIVRFDGDLTTDIRDFHIKENQWTHARNAFPEFGSNRIGNEPANKSCITTPYTINGFIYLFEDRWLVFSTDDTNSEVGILKEFTCEYTALPGDFNCLGLNRKNLITGVAKQNFDCTWSVYWSDGYLNSDRTLNIDNIPYVGTTITDPNGCQTFVPNQPLVLDCTKIRLNRLVKPPCIHIEKGPSGGSVLNGSYYATIAYSVNGQKVTNYSNLSNVVSLFSHENEAGALDIYITNLDDSYSEYELTVISIVNQQTVARRIGLYSTQQQRVSLDIISNELPSVPLQFLPVHNPLMESSKSITELSDHLIRIAPRTKFDFNYQPLANQIQVKWVSVEYPADYYRNGGTNTNFLRDENAALFVQWVYDDGDLSSSFHIPGRAPVNYPLPSSPTFENSPQVGIYPGTNYIFENVNTASQNGWLILPIGDGGYQIAEGEMGYYETDEKYPVDKPTVWGSLCGKNIRHHKFPERGLTIYTDIYSDTPAAIPFLSGPVIRVMGVKCLNIQAPVMNPNDPPANWIPIPHIVGYRILKGSREGNKTIIAEGIINNLFPYDLKDGSGKQGLYPNYPYNSIESDPFVSSNNIPTRTNAAGQVLNGTPNSFVNYGHVTFHSPDTTFRKPFLAAKELKIYGYVEGNPSLKFQVPDKHPKHKLLTNFAFFVAALTGLGYAVLKLNGKRSTKYIAPYRVGAAQEVVRRNGINTYVLANTDAEALAVTGSLTLGGGIAHTGATTGTVTDNTNPLGTPDTNAAGGILSGGAFSDAALAGFLTQTGVIDGGIDVAQAFLGSLVRDTTNSGVYTGLITAANLNPYVEGGSTETTFEGGFNGAMGQFFQVLGGASLFLNNWSEGTNVSIDALLNFSSYKEYALQQLSHCFYNTFTAGSSRNFIDDAQYLGNAIQQFGNGFKINNLYRASCVILHNSLAIAPVTGDDSKQTLKTLSPTYTTAIYTDPTGQNFPTTAKSYYAALKLRLRNQYGQIGDVKQIPIGCVNQVSISLIDPTVNIFSSPVIFGGDTYVTRYTEKNTMFFFYEWLFGQPDGFEYDYLMRRMLQYPMYWADTKKFDVADFLQGLVSTLTTGISGGFSQSPFPSGLHALDRGGVVTGLGSLLSPGAITNSLDSLFVVKNGYYYLFNSGVRDFYVESEVNVGYRDWEAPIQRRHYDNATFSSLPELFSANPDIIKADNFYKYDYSLSVSKSFINFASWANVQPTYYDPIKAETCFVNHPKRIIWSLPQQFEQIRDSWRIFLANDYRDFKTNVTTLESIGQTGALILFESDSPLQIQGVQNLQLGTGSVVTIGSGSFLSQAAQNMTNADRPYEYGACQNIRSVINTPAGLFWVGQNQGKIFSASGGLMDIAMAEMQYWFARYLPYKILEDFPTFELIDNAVAGVACQAVYDNRNALAYFTKKDYKLRNDLPAGTTVTYVSGNDFLVNGMLPVKVGDPAYFFDASWTVCYDVKYKKFVGWQDWHPGLTMPSKNTFNTILDNGVWKHNERYDLFCNYYGVDYPFEVEYMADTVLNVNSLKNIEYQLEIYKYDLNFYDRYLYLEENFDEAVVFNNEQVSGLLRLINTPFNDPWLINSYPIVNLASVDVLYSKVEQKYRFNQFFDLTDDRGEFTNAQRMIWQTDASGYKKSLNPTNLNYAKDPFQRKTFRHYANSVFLRRKVCGDRKFLFNFSINKNLPSQR